MYTILIIEDEPRVASLLMNGLEENGYQTMVAYDGLMGLRLFQTHTFDLVISDIVLPKMDGFELAKEIRKTNPHIPILMLTALGSTNDKLDGFDAGADDYIVKPFAFEELTARIRSLGRRSGKWEDDNLLTICDISYDCNARLLSGSTGSIRLSGREGRLLEVLLRSFELVIRREVLLSRVWGVDAEVEDCNLDTYIHYLRKRLSYVGSTLALKTIRGVGYTLASS